MLDRVNWRLRRFPSGDPVAEEDGSLHPQEVQESQRFRSKERKQGWRIGRAVCKQLLKEVAGLSCALSDIRIHSRRNNKGWPPWAEIAGDPAPWRLSIAHVDQVACAAIAPQGVGVGIDITPHQAVDRSFVDAWFHPEEQQLLATHSTLPPAAVWSIKEAAYKASCQGDTFKPNSFRVVSENGVLACRLRDEQVIRDIHHESTADGFSIALVATANPFIPADSVQ